MAAAISARESGVKDILVLERDQYLGGILNQCVHTGFGIDYFKEVLTGPEYADRFIKMLLKMPDIEISLKSFVTALTRHKELTYIKPGIIENIKARAIIMARVMGPSSQGHMETGHDGACAYRGIPGAAGGGRTRFGQKP